jgi:Icc-related predicted phosphoesterase
MNPVFARVNQLCLVWAMALLPGLTGESPKTSAASSQRDHAPVADIQVKNPESYPFRFVAYGDMRYAEHESYGKVIANAKARQQVLDQIVKEAPAFVVVTGDFVFRGFHSDDWTYFDRAIQPLRDRGIQIFPAIGNHEVGPFPSRLYGAKVFQDIEEKTEQYVASKGLDNYYKEFPNISHKPWYSVRYANCYFLVLDSEIDDEQSIAAQEQWIRTQLDSLPAEVHYLFVVLHRPPYTAVTDEGHKPRKMQIDLRTLLEAYQKNHRPHVIVIAGHVHNYERYKSGGVTYIVSGGGGAAPVKFARSAEDLYPKNALYGRNDPVDEDQYHYCLFTVTRSRLKFKMMKLVNKGESVAFEPRDSFELGIAAH